MRLEDEEDLYPGLRRWPDEPPWPVPRLHTPEREEACLAEGRFGVVDLDAASALLDTAYERDGDGWVEAVETGAGRWVRAAVWTMPPDRVLVEASSREAYDGVVVSLRRLTPPPRTRSEQVSTLERMHDPYGYGYRSDRDGRLHRPPMRKGRPERGAWESLQQLIEAEERRWIAAPNRWLGGRSPQGAADDPNGLYDVYELLEWIARARTDRGFLACFDLTRVRRALGMGRRW